MSQLRKRAVVAYMDFSYAPINVINVGGRHLKSRGQVFCFLLCIYLNVLDILMRQ